ncbi:plasmid pRiA4b ORF-3 family protein [Virgibacillus dakarensis]|nr:plasmid pRiA4b ORF-3 family protein [Virgibacillus dakarensis]
MIPCLVDNTCNQMKGGVTMLIQCTKKLLDQLKIKSAPKADENPFFSWHANLLYINRRKTVVLINDQTRYAIVLYGLKEKDFSQIHQRIVQAIQEVFQSEGISEEIVARYLEEAGELTFTSTKDRAAVARLNKACSYAEMFSSLMDIETGVANELSMRISHMLMSIGGKDYFQPNEQLYQELQQWAGKKIFDTRAVEMKVTLMLQGHEVWRRLVVPLNRTFHQLHEILQTAFDWMDYHLHEFYIFDQTTQGHETNWNDPAYTLEGYKPIVNLVCNQEAFSYPGDVQMRMENGIRLSEYIPASKLLMYNYDFGDDWRHKIEVIRVLEHYDGNHPACTAGAGNAPPEDVGGEGGYQWGRFKGNQPEKLVP